MINRFPSRFPWTFVFICFSALVAAEPARSEQNAGPACLYNSKSYSDGAYICVQKSLMLTCSSDGTRATWKIVADKDVSERCVNPIALSLPPPPRRSIRRTHLARHWNAPARDVSAKCFSFNGKQYCE